jgi:hypothetical protein
MFNFEIRKGNNHILRNPRKGSEILLQTFIYQYTKICHKKGGVLQIGEQ